MINININSHSLGGNKVLENVKLEIPTGVILGLVGVNGAGKSTLLRIMSGVYNADEGDVLYDGDSPKDASTRSRIFFLPDDPYYTSQTTCKSMLEMYRTFYPKMDIDVYKTFISKYSLDEKKPIRTFSKGMRRQLYIALALAIKPEYLLLDEAFDGLDPRSRKHFKDELIKLVDNNGTTVVISSHSLRELEDFCDMFAMLDNKTVSTSGDIEEKVERLCKFQLAFTSDVDDEALEALAPVALRVNGRFVQIVVEDTAENAMEKLKALEPAVIEEMPIDFEEMFISEVERGA